MLPSRNTPTCKKSVISPSISHVSTLSKFVLSTMRGQNIQCANAPSKSVTCSTVKSKRVNSDVNVIRKSTVNVVNDSVIAPVSPRLSSSSDDFTPQSYSDSIKRPKRVTGKIVSFCQDSKNVNNSHFRGKKKDNTLLKGFNNYHIKNTCFLSAIFWELLLLLIFVNNNLFSDRDLASSSNHTYNFFNSTLLLHRSPEVIVCSNSTNFLTNIFNNIYILAKFTL